MRTFTNRIARIEAKRGPKPGTLPTIIVVPADGPDRELVLADVERRRALGQNILAIGEADDALAELVEVFAP